MPLHFPTSITFLFYGITSSLSRFFDEFRQIGLIYGIVTYCLINVNNFNKKTGRFEILNFLEI